MVELLRSRGETTAIETLLEPYIGAEVLFARQPGNAGDCLIAAGTFQLFDRLGLSWRSVPISVSPDRTAGRVIFLSGGGNLAHDYPHIRDFIARHHRSAQEIVLLPHTVAGNEALLAELGRNVLLIARETRSFHHLLRHAPGARAALSHDLALDLDLERLRRAVGRIELVNRRDMRGVAGHLKRRIRLGVPAPGPVLNAFRTDSESRGAPLAEGNFDVSQLFAATGPAWLHNVVARRFLGILARHREIRTDRLHVCIGALLLGKSVVFHDNSYGKNRAVYEHSLKGRFPALDWRG